MHRKYLFSTVFCIISLTSTFAMNLNPFGGVTVAGDALKEGIERLTPDIQAASKGIAAITQTIAKDGIILKAELPATAQILADGLQQASKELRGASVAMIKEFSKKLAHAVMAVSSDTNETLAGLGNNLEEITETISKAIQHGTSVKIITDDKLNTAIEKIAREGIKTHSDFSINQSFLKTALIGSIGAAICITSLMIIYKELTKEAVIPAELSEEQAITWQQSFKKWFNKKYFLGTTGLIAGLILIAKSSSIGGMYA